MSSNGITDEPPLNRADEAQELLTALLTHIIPFIRTADQDAQTKHTGHALSIPLVSLSTSPSSSQSLRPAIVEQHAPKDLEKLLGLAVPEKGGGKEGLMETVEKVLGYSVNTWDQGFLDKLYGGTNAVGLVSELLLAVLNTNAHVYAVSPVLTLIERHTTTHLASLFSLPPPYSGGISQPGGSASNSTALVLARNTLYPSTKTSGNGSHNFKLFTSLHGHYSLEKAAQMFGLGSDAVVSVPVDTEGRMRVEELERLVRESKGRGETPFFVNATAGTTVLGSFDPFTEISGVCKKYNLWLHIDGSWGGSIIFNPTLSSPRLRGAELADSIAMTPHKMLGIPLTCSFLLVRDLRQLWAAMTLPASYLFHNENKEVGDVYDLAELTPQCGRRADSLKMFLALQYYGSSHFSSLITNAYANAEYLLGLVTASRHFVAVTTSPVPCLQVCFYYAQNGKLDEDNERNSAVTECIAGRLVKRGFMVDYAQGEKGKFFRVVVNGNTRKGTLQGLVKAIEEEGAGLRE